jgi:hypothetical protein
MEALVISLLIGLGLLLSGISWKGLARWVMGALGVAVLTVSLSRLCELYPNSCSLNCWIGQLSGQACVVASPTDPTEPLISPAHPISPAPPISPSLPVSPGQVPSPTLPSLSPIQPLPSPSQPLPSLVQPLPSQRPVTPSPVPAPCADGKCDCVNYKCLW